jgi:hypothetical protein
VFQPHGCLSFEGHFARETEQCGCGVEEAPYRSGWECSSVFADQLLRLLKASRKEERRGAEIGKIFDLSEESGGGLHGISRCGVASREGGLAQMGYAREALEHAAHE